MKYVFIFALARFEISERNTLQYKYAEARNSNSKIKSSTNQVKQCYIEMDVSGFQKNTNTRNQCQISYKFHGCHRDANPFTHSHRSRIQSAIPLFSLSSPFIKTDQKSQSTENRAFHIFFILSNNKTTQSRNGFFRNWQFLIGMHKFILNVFILRYIFRGLFDWNFWTHIFSSLRFGKERWRAFAAPGFFFVQLKVDREKMR